MRFSYFLNKTQKFLFNFDYFLIKETETEEETEGGFIDPHWGELGS